jgi:origin recognition complex subunit 3
VPIDLCRFIELARQLFSEHGEYFEKELETVKGFHKELLALFTDEEMNFEEAMEMFYEAANEGRGRRREEELNDYYVQLAIKHNLLDNSTRQSKVSRRAQNSSVFLELSSSKGGIKDQEYEYLPVKVSNWFAELFASILETPYREMPFYEIYYYKNVSMLERGLRPQPRACVQSALSNPNFYLNGQSSMTDGIDPSNPDTTLAYKLYLECGRLINLYDWFSAFKAILECEGNYTDEAVTQFKAENGDGDDTNASNKDKEKVNEEEKQSEGEVEDLLRNKFAQARFIRAVSELQFLGFVKPTQKKTDHVMRLTWGSV